MRLVHAHVTDLMIVAVKDDDLLRLLNRHRCAARKSERYATGPTLVARSRIAFALERDFAVAFHDAAASGFKIGLV